MNIQDMTVAELLEAEAAATAKTRSAPFNSNAWRVADKRLGLILDEMAKRSEPAPELPDTPARDYGLFLAMALCVLSLVGCQAQVVEEAQPSAGSWDTVCSTDPENLRRLSTKFEGLGVACPPPPPYDKAAHAYTTWDRGPRCLFSYGPSGEVRHAEGDTDVKEALYLCQCTPDGGQKQYTCEQIQ